jgi:hypothetical protein
MLDPVGAGIPSTNGGDDEAEDSKRDVRRGHGGGAGIRRAQAFASPGAVAEAEAERACNGGQCNRDCRARGYDGGFCDQGGCICIIEVTPEA